MKKILSLILAALMLTGMLSGCGEKAPASTAAPTAAATEAPTTVATEPLVTEPAQEAGVLKVLTLGHSLAVDSGHMLALIANAEGYKEMKVATLYYSGCPLYKHVEFMNSGSTEYKLYLSSTENPNSPPEIMSDITMEAALRFDYWDIIVMQGGVFEIAEDGKYKDGNIQRIQEFVNKYKLNPNAIFAWNMAWAPPVDNTLRDQYPYENNTYYTSYLPYGDNRTNLYNAITKCVNDNILTDETFRFMIPSGTAMENALSSYLEETDLHRDYVHATDFARVMISYVWFCRLTGVDHLDEIKLDTIPKQFFKSTQELQDRVLTDMEKNIILEAVNNALANPLEMTQSQYTEAPAA